MEEKQLELYLPPVGKFTACITDPEGHRWVRLLIGEKHCAADNCKNPVPARAVICPSCWSSGWQGEELIL